MGGVETHALETGKILVKDGHTVVVVTENHSWSATESVQGIQVYRIPVGKDDWFKKFRVWLAITIKQPFIPKLSVYPASYLLKSYPIFVHKRRILHSFAPEFTCQSEHS